MNGYNYGFVAYQLLVMISLTKSEDLCAGEEPTVIRTVGASMGVNSFIFVQNSQNVAILRQIKLFPESNHFSAVANTEELDDILNDEMRQREYFDKRMILVTKEKLNFTNTFEKLLDSAVAWIVFPESLEELQNFYIPINSNFFIVHCTYNRVILDKAYHIKRGFDLSVNNIQSWPKGAGDGMVRIFENLEIDFKGTTLNFLKLTTEKECHNKTLHVLNKMECYHQEIIKIIAERLNITMNTILCPERQYPYNYPNGSLSEMFGYLERKEADISSGSYIISGLRLVDYDFAWPTFTTKSMMYIKFENGKSSWRAYLRPVSYGVWKAIICLIVLTGFLLQLFNRFREGNLKFGFSLIPEFLQCLFLSLQVFCNQGVHNMSRWSSCRIVFILTFLLCVSLYQAYSGFLISSLTVATPYIPFTDLNGFLNDGTYRIITLRRGFHNYFVTKIITEKVDNGEELTLPDLPETPNLAINKLCEIDKLTYVEFRENIVQHELPCRIIEFSQPLLYQSIGIGLVKNSPLKEILNQHVNVLRGTGILHRMREYLLSFVNLHERETSREEFINVSLWHVISIFFIVCVGTVLSIVIFLLEILCNFLNTPKVRHKPVNKLKPHRRILVQRKKYNSDRLFHAEQKGGTPKYDGSKLMDHLKLNSFSA